MSHRKGSLVTFEVPSESSEIPQLVQESAKRNLKLSTYSAAEELKLTNIARQEQMLSYRQALLEDSDPLLVVERERREVELARRALEEKKRVRAAIAAAKRQQYLASTTGGLVS